MLDRLLEPFSTDPSIGVVSPKIRYFDDPQIIQYAGYTEVNPFTGRNKTIGGQQEDKGQHDTPGYTAYAHGASMMVKKELVDAVGFLPDIFFMSYEDLDWSAQIRRAGYKIFYQPTALVYHKESISIGKESANKAYFHNRSRILFMRRNTNRYQFWLFLVYLSLVVLPKTIIKYAVKGQFVHLEKYLRRIGLEYRNTEIRFFVQVRG